MFFLHLIFSSREERISSALIYFFAMTHIFKLFQALDISVILFAFISATTNFQFLKTLVRKVLRVKRFIIALI
jgi:hypothetical protein